MALTKYQAQVLQMIASGFVTGHKTDLLHPMRYFYEEPGQPYSYTGLKPATVSNLIRAGLVSVSHSRNIYSCRLELTTAGKAALQGANENK